MHDFLPSFLRTLYVMRHGHSEANAQHLIVSSLELGTVACGLTEQGRVQVAHQVDAWKQHHAFESTGEIYCSPFVRTRDTAALASSALDWPVVAQASSLRERFFGDLDGQDDTHYAQVWAQDALDPGHRLWHVESALEVRDRILTFLTTLAAAHHGQPLLLVTHGDTASILLAALGHGDLRRHRASGALSTGEIRRCY